MRNVIKRCCRRALHKQFVRNREARVLRDVTELDKRKCSSFSNCFSEVEGALMTSGTKGLWWLNMPLYTWTPDACA